MYLDISRHVLPIDTEPGLIAFPYILIFETGEDMHELPSAEDFIKRIRDRIFTEIGVTASAGISSNKLLARLSTRVAKPNGLKLFLVQFLTLEVSMFCERLM
jgi:nucleotidyltransferase/DNA polymerase involved in DNA repair